MADSGAPKETAGRTHSLRLKTLLLLPILSGGIFLAYVFPEGWDSELRQSGEPGSWWAVAPYDASAHSSDQRTAPSAYAGAVVQAAIWCGGFVPFVLLPRSRWVALILGALAAAALSLMLGSSKVGVATRNGAFVFCLGGLGWLLAEPGIATRVLFLIGATLVYWILLQVSLHLVERSGPFYLWQVRPRFGPILMIWLPTTPFIVAWAVASRPGRPAP